MFQFTKGGISTLHNWGFQLSLLVIILWPLGLIFTIVLCVHLLGGGLWPLPLSFIHVC